MNNLAIVWAGIIAFIIIMYIILDGFDLGIGIISILFDSSHDRDLMVTTIAPVWDGNQTWLVFAGAALYGAFPLAFGMIMPSIYTPIIIMIVALIFRGVSFEFRLKSGKSKKMWEISFFVGSLIATVVQGIILGTFLQGFNNITTMHLKNHLAWLNLFNIATSFLLISSYILLGSNWLIYKTVNSLQSKCYKISTAIQYPLGFLLIVLSLWTPFLNDRIYERWFKSEDFVYLLFLPIGAVMFWIGHWHALRQKLELAPFLTSIGIFILCYIGFLISLFPYIVPGKLTFMDAAANTSTLKFMLIGFCIIIPFLLLHTFNAYYLFKGKVTEKLGY